MTPDKHANPVGDSAAPTDPAALARRLISRRALVRAGWVAPVVLGLSMLPTKAFASPGIEGCAEVRLEWDPVAKVWVEVCVSGG